MQIKARINAHLFRIASDFLSPTRTIEYINGIRLERHAEEGIVITATDGNRFVILHDKEGFLDGDSVTIDVNSDILGEIPSKREKAKGLTILVEGNQAQLVGDFDMFIDEFEVNYPSDQNYPKWREYIPEYQSNPIEFYNSEDLKDFVRAARDLTGNESNELSFAGKRGGIVVVRILNFENAFFLAVRKNRSATPGLPDFALKVIE